jgi:hypothetical protein
MIRTVWLALICLTGLGVLGAMKMAAAPLTTADASHVETTIATTAEHGILAKADKLEVYHVEPVPGSMVVTPVAIVLPKTAPKPAETTKIVSRHWHDPLAPKAAPIADQSKRKPSKRLALTK